MDTHEALKGANSAGEEFINAERGRDGGRDVC